MANLLARKSLPTSRRLMVFGSPSTGKTRLVGELTAQFKLLWLDLDQGVDTLYQTLPDEQLANIEYIPILDTADDPISCNTVSKMMAAVRTKTDHYICTDHSTWDCVKCKAKRAEFFTINFSKLTPADGWVIVIDSGTHFSESCLQRILVNSKIDPTKAGKEDKATFGVYMGQGAMLHKALTDIQNSGLNVVMTAHEWEVDMPDKSKKLVPSMGTRKFAPTVVSYFSNLIRTAQVNRNYKIESANASSLNADVGGHINLDLNKPDVSICDYFTLVHQNSGDRDSSLTTAKLGSSSTTPAPTRTMGGISNQIVPHPAPSKDVAVSDILGKYSK